MKRLLVTGGCGFIGSNFIRFMTKKYEDLEILNMNKTSYWSLPTNLGDVDPHRCRLVTGDITDLDLVEKLVEDSEAVVNFAGESHVDKSIARAFPFFKSNTQGVITLLEALIRHKNKRLVQISTDEVYGGISEGSFSEDDRTRPSSPYAASKAAAEDFCFGYHRTHGVDVVVCRSANNFGPYQFPEKLIPKTIIRAKLGLKIPVYGTGRNVREWIHVQDHCRAIDAVLANGRSGEVYNIASGKELMNIEVVRQILELLGKSDELVEFVDDRPGHDIRYSLDPTKIRTELGWEPQRSFDGALSETVGWYINNEEWWRGLANETVLHPTPWKLRW